MSNQPLEKASTSTQLDPRKMTISEYSRYQSNEMAKFASSLRSYKRSLLYLGGTLALTLFVTSQFNKMAHE